MPEPASRRQAEANQGETNHKKQSSDNQMDRVNWGIIGAGNVTEVKSGPALYRTERSRLMAVMRRDGEKAAGFARRHDVGRWYTKADDLIHDPEVNAVYVATPPSTHSLYASLAMKAGKPVYVEKPMAARYDECLEMLRVSRETGMPLFVAYYRRTLPAFLKVKELIDAGEIGKVLTVSIRLHRQAAEREQEPAAMDWRVDPAIAGGGYFYDLASHQLDYLDFLFGPLSGVRGTAANMAGLYPAEDTVTGTFAFADGMPGSGSWCFACGKEAETDLMEFTGEKGRITLPCFQHGEMILENRQGRHAFRFVNPEHIQQNLVRQVVGALLDGTPCVSTGESAARTNRVLEEMTGSYYGKREENPAVPAGSGQHRQDQEYHPE